MELLLYEAANLDIYYDPKWHIMFDIWKGRQTKESIFEGGEVIYNLFHERPECCRILNDNTRKVGEFYHSIQYTADVWFPKMIAAGLQHFAWVFSPDIFTQLSASKALQQHSHVVQVFNSYQLAYDWLLKQNIQVSNL